ncbi:MAG: SIR2 family protein [Chloroflexota bacterium]|nr:SIR2 family protein [Chloroflexota bacterium]
MAGCPDWNQFATATLEFFVGHGAFSHAQLDQVQNLHPRIKLSIALSLQKRTGIPLDYRALLHRVPRAEHANGRLLYSYLSKLSTTFVTTNYDEWLDEEIPVPAADLAADTTLPTHPPPKARTVYYKTHDLTPANLNQENVVMHLHGSVKDPPGMILTTPQYVRHYAQNRYATDDHPENPVLTFLEHLFRHKTVLFIGYGLTELEILEYVMLKAPVTGNSELHSAHYLLHGFYSHQRELMLNMRNYYHDCGIELLPFLKDHLGWEQLLTVLESFACSMPASRLMVSQDLKEMEALLHG